MSLIKNTITFSPKEDIATVENNLSRLWRQTLMAKGIDSDEKLTLFIERFYGKQCSDSVPSSFEKYANGVKNELCCQDMTWNVFLKGMAILEGEVQISTEV